MIMDLMLIPEGYQKDLKSLFPKRLILTFDVFEKTAKNRIEAFLCEYFVNFTFWGLPTYTSSKPKSLKN